LRLARVAAALWCGFCRGAGLLGLCPGFAGAGGLVWPRGAGKAGRMGAGCP
jgi:hypothetical protein